MSGIIALGIHLIALCLGIEHIHTVIHGICHRAEHYNVFSVWTYGEKKDNDLKTTPLLVPYDELAESEKEYDRNTALETLKLIVKMGYRIELRDPNQ